LGPVTPTNPVDEAARWLDSKLGAAPVPPLLLVIGLGEGHLLDLLETRAPGTKVLAVEHDPHAAEAFRARRDWTPWLDSGRLLYLVGPEYAGKDEAWRMFPPGSEAHTLLVHPAIERNVSEAAVRAAKVVKDIIFGVRANAEARRRFAPRYLVNSLRNLAAIVHGRDVRALTDAYAGVPAVVIGAGPSLDRNIEELRPLASRALLVATDTAVRPLLHAGLPPNLAVGLDPSELNARHFRDLPDTQTTWLVAESALDSAAREAFAGRTFWFRVANHHPWPWFNDLGIDVGRIDVWGSVLTAAFQVAVLAGCDPIVLVGADLAFTDARPYARGTTYEFDWTREVAAGATLERAWHDQMARSQDRIELPDVHGSPVTTTRTLQEFRDWLAARAARSGRRVVNATGAGIFAGAAVEQARLGDVLTTPQTIRDVEALGDPPTTRAAVATLRDRVAAAAAHAEESDVPPLTAWRDFCEAGFDAHAVASAMARAERELADEVPPQTTAPLDARCGISGLPEREAVVRAALRGEPLPTWPDLALVEGERAAAWPTALTDAAVLLARLLALDGVPLVDPAHVDGADIEARWGESLLDRRFDWAPPEWRRMLWDYHDALAVGVATGAAPPDAGALALLAAPARDLVSCIADEPRRCEPEDVRMQESFVGTHRAYNILKTRTGIVLAAWYIGETSGLDRGVLSDYARRGWLLWVDSADAAPGRADHYVRDALRIALLHGWATIVGRFRPDCLGTSEAGAPDVFRTLLDAAAGSMSPLAAAPLQDALIALLIPRNPS
jgi:hypothetical protein